MLRSNTTIYTTTALFMGILGLAACSDDGEGTESNTEETTGDGDGDPGDGDGDPTTGDGDGDPTTGDGDGDPTTGDGDSTDDVVEIAIRRLDEGQDLAEFEAARDAFVDLLTMQPGVGTDREFMSFFDYSVFDAPNPPVYIGMTQYDTLADFQAAGEALGMSPEAGAFFSTFTPELFTVLVPLEQGSEVDLAGIADAPGQVLEVAVRDLSVYENFDPAAYAAARDAFLALLAQQPGFVQEYQWVSPVDADVAVGMTVYASAEAFVALSMDADFNAAPEVGAFIGAYPPIGGHINAVVK